MIIQASWRELSRNWWLWFETLAAQGHLSVSDEDSLGYKTVIGLDATGNKEIELAMFKYLH